MSNKLSVNKNKMASLGIKKNEQNDYVYINPEEKNKSKYNSIKKVHK
ncbi:hypothetical protein [Clostridium estertheticum]|nr:hypothetical protein [Clostridium estertheticum]MBU3073047.1 hypothetical protein [Clostridium estertheticum]MBU3162916.1 hypothetical protein [Clostridium estertheticum]MBU3183652.1 hypothetical protein [Clostridium estertheticum]